MPPTLLFNIFSTFILIPSEWWRHLHRLHQSSPETSPACDGASRDQAAVHLRCPQGGQHGQHDREENILLPATGCHQTVAHQQQHHREWGDPRTSEEIYGGGQPTEICTFQADAERWSRWDSVPFWDSNNNKVIRLQRRAACFLAVSCSPPYPTPATKAEAAEQFLELGFV